MVDQPRPWFSHEGACAFEMSFDWKRYYSVAVKLVETPELHEGDQEEAMCRAAISRAYYAVFNMTISYLESLLGETPYSDKHRWAIDRMKGLSLTAHAPNDVKIKRAAIHTALEKLRTDRNDADYEASLKDLPMRCAKLSLKHAKRGIENLEQLQVQ
jgi:hypothetical protein